MKLENYLPRSVPNQPKREGLLGYLQKIDSIKLSFTETMSLNEVLWLEFAGLSPPIFQWIFRAPLRGVKKHVGIHTGKGPTGRCSFYLKTKWKYTVYKPIFPWLQKFTKVVVYKKNKSLKNRSTRILKKIPENN